MVLRKLEIKDNRYFLEPRCFCGCGKGLDDLFSSLLDHVLWLYTINPPLNQTANTSPKYSMVPFFPPSTISDGREGWLDCFLRRALKDWSWASFIPSCFTNYSWFQFCKFWVIEWSVLLLFGLIWHLIFRNLGVGYLSLSSSCSTELLYSY